jgi:hypothetical protein
MHGKEMVGDERRILDRLPWFPDPLVEAGKIDEKGEDDAP